MKGLKKNCLRRNPPAATARSTTLESVTVNPKMLLETLVSISQLSVASHVTPTITREIVYQCHVDDQMSFTCKVDVLNL